MIVQDERQIELDRIRSLADSLPDPQDALAAILKHIDESYFYKDSRLSAAELLTPDLKDQAKKLHKIIGASDFPGCLKQRICGAVEFYLRNNCAVGSKEMAAFKAGCAFDPVTFNLFEGLED
jgi:hypothetical protein